MRTFIVALFLIGCHEGEHDTAGAAPRSTPSASTASTASITPDAARAIAHEDACNGGDQDECVLLGVDYEWGRGVPQDRPRAAKLFHDACLAKNGAGCTFYGVMVQWGRGVPKEKWKSRGLPSYGRATNPAYAIACDAGDAAICWLMGSPERRERAAKLNAEACDAHDMMACDALGDAYAHGDGAPKNDALALRRYDVSCEGGDASGCLSLGYVFEQGLAGKSKDAEKAGAYFVRACDGGEDMGCENAGHLYEYGTAVKANRALAHRVYKVACDRGDDAACGAEQRTR